MKSSGSFILLLALAGCEAKFSPSDDDDLIVDAGSEDAASSDGGIEDSGAPDDSGTPPPVEDAGAPEEDAGTVGEVPSCEILVPVDDSNIGYSEDITFSATASDPEDGALSGASIVWTSNLVSGNLGTGNMLTRSLGVVGEHTITCTVTDSDSNTGTATITVDATSPVAEISAPADGAAFTTEDSISLSGRGRDAEDGDLVGADLIWYSNLDGQLGTGESVQVNLTAGTHIITLLVEDSAGNVDIANISVTVS